MCVVAGVGSGSGGGGESAAATLRGPVRAVPVTVDDDDDLAEGTESATGWTSSSTINGGAAGGDCVVTATCSDLDDNSCSSLSSSVADPPSAEYARIDHLAPDWFYLSGTDLPRLSWKRGC